MAEISKYVISPFLSAQLVPESSILFFVNLGILVTGKKVAQI